MGRTIAYAFTASERLPDLQLSVIDSYGTRGAAFMPLFFAAACARLVFACLIGGADVVHIHMSQQGSALRKGILLLLATLCRVRTVLHLHGSRFKVFVEALPTWARRLLIWTMRKADRIIVIADVWKVYARELGFPDEQIILIHNGVPDRGARTAPNDIAAPVRLLALGELGFRKGTDDILAALSAAPLKDQAWHAVLAGNGPVEHYRALAASAGLSDRIEIPGWVNAATVEHLLNAADILLLPSHNEGLPLAILEALAAEVAVISTPVGGIPDAVIDGQTGLLVPPGQPALLGQAISRLIAEPTLRRRLAQQGRHYFLRHFDLNITFGRIAEIYRALRPRLSYSP